MIWLIAFVFFLLVFFWAMIFCGDSCGETIGGLSVLGMMFFGIVSLVVAVDGVTMDRDLIKQKAKIEALEAEVARIKNAYYQEDQKLGLANFKQSKELSEYLKEIARLKADYNSKLAAAQYDRHHLKMKIWGKGMFISSVVDSLKPLK